MNINNITGNAKEVEKLSDITDVTFENNRLVLRVSDPIAARKFGLSDSTWRYEFDGASMYWYKDKDESVPSSWNCSCGRGGHTLVDSSTEAQIRSVKKEMTNQVVLKGMLDHFGNSKRFTDVAIELNSFYYDKNGCLHLRNR